MRAWVLASMMLLFSSCAFAQTEPATVILVRHAEKEAEPKDDPPLSIAGRERTFALLQLVRDAGVDVVYHTNRLRNFETARILRDSLKAPLVEVKISNAEEFAREVVQRLRQHGGVSVVVGHSNTYGPIIEALGGPAIEEIADPRYDDVFILTVQDGKPTRMLRAKYGRRFEP